MVRAALTITAIFLVAVESPAAERSLRVDVVGNVDGTKTNDWLLVLEVR